jgi:hypothetical protein
MTHDAQDRIQFAGGRKGAEALALRRRRFRLGWAALAAFMLGAPMATGGNTGAGDKALDVTIMATDYAHIPKGTAFRVEAARDTELALYVERLVRGALPAAQFAGADDSPLVLTVDAEATDLASWDDPGTAEMTASNGNVRLRAYLWAPNGQGILQENAAPSRRGLVHRLTATVYDRRTGRYLWRGSAETCQCGNGALADSRKMVPPLIEAIGRTVGGGGRPFE